MTNGLYLGKLAIVLFGCLLVGRASGTPSPPRLASVPRAADFEAEISRVLKLKPQLDGVQLLGKRVEARLKSGLWTTDNSLRVVCGGLVGLASTDLTYKWDGRGWIKPDGTSAKAAFVPVISYIQAVLPYVTKRPQIELELLTSLAYAQQMSGDYDSMKRTCLTKFSKQVRFREQVAMMLSELSFAKGDSLAREGDTEGAGYAYFTAELNEVSGAIDPILAAQRRAMKARVKEAVLACYRNDAVRLRDLKQTYADDPDYLRRVDAALARLRSGNR